MEVTCRCGWTTRGSKSEVIANIQAHGRSEHQQEITQVVVHSTSWRHEESLIILTYVAVVSLPSSLPPDSLVAMPVRRAELARGEAMSAPKSIGVEAVLEHALRHLSWLIRDDPAVMTALAGWQEVLAGFEPEP